VTTRHDWTELRERSNVVALRLMRWVATTLGRRAARLVLHPVTFYFMLVGGTSKRASAMYLRQLWNRRPRWIERYRHLHCFASTVLDRVYLLQGRYDEFDVQAIGGEHFEAVARGGGGVLFVGAHVGSFEALRALGKYRRSLRVAMVMYDENARLINAALKAVAPEAELNVISLGRVDAMLALKDWLDGGGVAGLLADRSLPRPRPSAAVQGEGAREPPRGDAIVLPFLGRHAVFHDGVFRLAAVLRRPMVFMAGLYRGGNRYELRFMPVADFTRRERGPGAAAAQDRAIREAMERYVAILEAVCHEAPYNWFNFYDFWDGGSHDADAAGTAVPGTAGTSSHAASIPARRERDAHV